MIGKTYITPNLVLPFVHGKPIKFKFQDEQEFQAGEIDIQAFQDGSCNIQILSAGRGLVTWHGAGSALDSRMLEKISWDKNKEEFVGIFDRAY
jgi:hypothetical protein